MSLKTYKSRPHSGRNLIFLYVWSRTLNNFNWRNFLAETRKFLIGLFVIISTLFLAPQAWSQTSQDETSNPIQIEESSEDYPIIYDEDLLRDSFRELKRDESIQYDLADVIPPKPQSAFSKALSDFFLGLFKILFPILELCFWIGVGILIMSVLYLIGRTIYETRFAKPVKKEKHEDPEIPLYEPARAQARILLDEVDRLAAEGKYGEAVHTLLFRSIQDIDRNRPNVIRRSLTAREIGSLSILTQNSRQAFSTIAGVSELSHFGGTPIGKSGFDVARQAYAQLTGQSTETSARRRRR